MTYTVLTLNLVLKVSKFASAIRRNRFPENEKLYVIKMLLWLRVFAGKLYGSVKRAIDSQTTVWSSTLTCPCWETILHGSHISAHLVSEALGAIYSWLCLQSCLTANSLGRWRQCLPPEKRIGIFTPPYNKDKSPCRGKVRHASCPLEKIQSP